MIAGAALALIIGVMAAIMFASHRPGHWWGDDWALYLRQAQALLEGAPREVFDENRFAVETSQGAAFSPPLYPWGFPIMLAPFVAVVGPDVDRLVIVSVLCACAYAASWYALARPRIGYTAALVGVVAVTITPLLLGWTELIQSEWAFLAVSGIGLVVLDRVARSQMLTTVSAPVWPLVIVGIAAAAAFTVRREGLAMVAAIAAAQLAAIIAAGRRPWTAGSPRGPLIARLLLPHATALAAVAVIQVTLPSTLIPQYSGNGISNVWRLREAHLDHLAEVSGFKHSWADDPTVLGSTTLGWVVLIVYVAAAGAGIALALTRFRVRDLHLVAYAVVAFAIGGSFRSAINRYVATVAPLLLLLGLVAVHTLVAVASPRRTRRWAPAAVVTIVVMAIAAGNLVQARDRIERATELRDSGAIEWGPTHPDAIAMFDIVERVTSPDDVVASPKARAMTFATGRRSVQVDDYRPMPVDLEIALVVVETGTDLAGALAARPDEYTLVWGNTRFRVYQPNIAASASTNDAGSSSTASP